MSVFKYTTTFLVLSAAFASPLQAKKTQSERKKALTPEEQLKTFTLPEGFTIELVASEKNGLINPIDISFDDAGRLWTQTAEMYPLDPLEKRAWKETLEVLDKGENDDQPEFKRVRDLYQLKTRGKDKILVIQDPTKKATGQLHAFAEGMTIPQSILPYKNGVFVAHGSEMLFLKDEDGDGMSDKHETVLTGFGFSDTHTMSHTLVRGPGGWVHFSHGALNKGEVTAVRSGESTEIGFSKIARFSLDGNKIEIVNNGLNNIWGFQLKANGQWYGTEANDNSYSLTPFHPLMGYSGIGNDKLSPHQPFPGPFHEFKVNGTGISGLAYDENGSRGFPEKWKNIGFLANPITNTINCVVADRNADGSVISEHLPDFLSSSDDWFRPVNMEFGPDGCLYVVDWYNKIVSHNEVAREHPDRDKEHGRIWRIRHESQQVTTIPDIIKASDEDLLKHLAAEVLWEKRAAWHQIADRQAKELAPALGKMAADTSQTLTTRILALWSLESLGVFDMEIMKALTADKDPDLRREALRSLISFQPGIEDLVTLTKPLINDLHYMVREQVLRTLGNVSAANEETIEMLVSAAKPEMKNKNDFGKGYENNFQRFLALLSLESHLPELATFLNSPATKDFPTANLNEAAQVLPKGERTASVLAALESGKAVLDANTLVSLSESLEEPEVIAALEGQLDTEEFIELAMKTQPRLRSSAIVKALTPGLKTLIKSDSPDDKNLALKAAIAFQTPAINDEVVALATSMPASDLTPQLLEALAIAPKTNKIGLQGIVAEASLNTNMRMEALSTLALVEPKEATASFIKLYKASDETSKSSLITTAAGTKQGCLFVLDLIQKKLLPPAKLDLAISEKLIDSQPKHPARKLVAPLVKSLAEQQDAAGDKKIEEYLKATKTLTGNPEIGKGLFISCLQCHQAGGEGYELAPALDGSSNRDIEHMLTAIVKPNEAAEGGYLTYRITKKNGRIIDGYMFNTNKNGTTLGFMGGSTRFIPKEQIERERFLRGKSFMPPSFGAFPDQTMVDLISYLRTLK
ncbi:MAG: PVC-type heme-binding CxxCH protein [Luteolibacter sp.]